MRRKNFRQEGTALQNCLPFATRHLPVADRCRFGLTETTPSHWPILRLADKSRLSAEICCKMRTSP
jgi:hypothetical protein